MSTSLSHSACRAHASVSEDPCTRKARALALYAAHEKAIRARCRALLRDVQAAEDATQETFIRVLHHIDEAPQQDDVRKWLYRIATNYCLNELRNRKTKTRLSVHLNDFERESDALDETLARRQLARRVLASLPESVRAVSLLRHVDGLYDREVAEELGISRRTVAYRLNEFRVDGLRLLAPAHPGQSSAASG